MPAPNNGGITIHICLSPDGRLNITAPDNKLAVLRLLLTALEVVAMQQSPEQPVIAVPQPVLRLNGNGAT